MVQQLYGASHPADFTGCCSRVQGSALAQGPAQEAAGVPARALRIPPEQNRLRVGGHRGQPKQVSSFDPRQRPIQIPGHTAILVTTEAGSPDTAAIGMRVRASPVPGWQPMQLA
jgi:hypothetical protein